MSIIRRRTEGRHPRYRPTRPDSLPFACGTTPRDSASRGAAKDSSPGRKPWEHERGDTQSHSNSIVASLVGATEPRWDGFVAPTGLLNGDGDSSLRTSSQGSRPGLLSVADPRLG